MEEFTGVCSEVTRSKPPLSFHQFTPSRLTRRRLKSESLCNVKKAAEYLFLSHRPPM